MEIAEMAKLINENGGQLYLVGGAVRDKILYKNTNQQNIEKFEAHDEDYCVVNMTSEKFLQLFPQAHPQGKFFEVYEIDKKQFAMARAERKTGEGHKEFEIQTGVSIEEDLKRRDITINSIAQNVLTQEIIDPFEGIKDIENKIIRKTSDSFREDPLRIYRVARFAATLQFKVEDNTIEEMKKIKPELKTLSAERVFDEFRKALNSDKPSIFFDVLRKAEVLDIHFKEIYDLIGSIQPEKYHPEGDSYNHTMQVVDLSAILTDDLQIRFSALVHDLGKGVTPKEMQPHHYGHDEKGAKLVANFGRRLKIPNSWIKCGKVSAKEHMKGGILDKMTIPKQVDFITRVDKSMLKLEGMAIVVFCDKNRGESEEKSIEKNTEKSTEKNTEKSIEKNSEKSIEKNSEKNDKREQLLKEANNANFIKIGKQCLEKIDGKYIEEKYNIKPCEKVGQLLRQKRINWMKKYISTIDV